MEITSLADNVLDHLFLVWVRSPHTTEQMWQAFHEKLSHLADWVNVVKQWKAMVVELTKRLCKYIYHVKEKPQQDGEGSARKSNGDSLGVQWTENSIRDMWFTILNILGNLNLIANPQNYEIALKCLAEVINILLQGEHQLPLNSESEGMPLMEIFLPWLLEASNSPM